MEKEESTGTDLHLDTTRQMNGERQNESVTDKYGINVFTDYYQDCMSEVNNMEATQNTQLQQQIFLNVQKMEDEKSLTEALFQEPHLDMNVTYDTQNTNTKLLYGIWILIIIVFACVMIYRKFGRKKKNEGRYAKNRK